MDFDVLGIRIKACEWDRDLVIRGDRSYDRPVSTFFHAVFIDGIRDVVGKEILCVEVLEKGIYQIQYMDDKDVTILAADRYDRLIFN